MKRNRFILCGAILASGTFASFFGGTFSYALFYLTLIVPVLSLAYTFFVYIRFRLYQKIQERKVLKGELVPYEFTLSNEDIISFTNIKVNFFTDKSYVTDAQAKTEYLLLPGQSDTLKTTLCCKYRGEYDVGVKSVEVTDYLYLFSITYPIFTKLNLTVLPQVFTVDKLRISEDEQDPKKTRCSSRFDQETLDIDVRKYAHGDNKRHIHWKASAKQNELMTRKITENAKTRVLMILDLAPVHEKDLSRIIIEDQILESALSIADYYKNNSTDVCVCYDRNGSKQENIRSDSDFKLFYEHCAALYFNARSKAEEILLSQLQNSSEVFFGILLTHSLTLELYEAAADALLRGNRLSILLISDDTSSGTMERIHDFSGIGIPVYRITREDNVSDILSA